LAQKIYDVVVIGGGIYGVSVARDAVLRGLTVSLIDQGDFANASSSNHHKIIHGGLRYLQHGDFKRMRESTRERSVLLRIAPHLVQPLPFLIPTYRRRFPGRLAMAMALKLNDLLSFDRNRQLARHKKIPRGRIMSKVECLQLCPKIDPQGLTGGALFFDAQVHSPDRLNLALLFSAARAGAELANYVRVGGFLKDRSGVSGVRVKDMLSGDEFTIRARLIVNCAGPWLDHVLRLLTTSTAKSTMRLLKAVVLITRPVVRNVAVGIPSRARYSDADAIVQKGHRYFFITPWRHTSLIGTFQSAHGGHPDELAVTDEEIGDFICQINGAFPGAVLEKKDVYRVLCGLLPAAEQDGTDGDAQLEKRAEIRDHASADGIPGLISVSGVKYTTARSVAEHAVDLIFMKLARKPVHCRTTEIPALGGDIDCFEAFAERALRRRPTFVSAETLTHLLQNYGSEYRSILRYCEDDPAWGELLSSDSPVIKAEALHGVRVEMAQKLTDVVFRRTELATAGYPGDACLRRCAEIMAAELGWNTKRICREIDDVQQAFAH
jgi:glycerol-3-phosphate dehydrogenase